MKAKQIKGMNGKIAYWISQEMSLSKDTLFFLHGLTADHTMFSAQIPYFENDYNIILWDAPAHGESRPCTGFSYKLCAEAIKQILDKEKIHAVILVGQSMGGYIAQAFISQHPDMIKAFVSIDSTPYGDYYSKTDKWILRQIEWMAKLYPERLLKSALAKQVATTERGRSNMSQMVAGFKKSELCHLMGVAYAGFLDDNHEIDIPCPALLIVGENDRTGKVKQYNRAWSRNTDFKLVWIENAAHNSNVDNPEAVNAAISSFLQEAKNGI